MVAAVATGTSHARCQRRHTDAGAAGGGSILTNVANIDWHRSQFDKCSSTVAASLARRLPLLQAASVSPSRQCGVGESCRVTATLSLRTILYQFLARCIWSQ
jgi:hypothetical protein